MRIFGTCDEHGVGGGETLTQLSDGGRRWHHIQVWIEVRQLIRCIKDADMCSLVREAGRELNNGGI